MRKQRTNLTKLEGAKLTVLHLQQTKGGGPGVTEDEDSWSTPGRP